jgi:hypothetical protein
MVAPSLEAGRKIPWSEARGVGELLAAANAEDRRYS